MNDETVKNPVKAIRQHCMDCCCGNSAEVDRCTMEGKCPLYPFRKGKNPYRKQELSEEERQRRSERMKAIKKSNEIH